MSDFDPLVTLVEVQSEFEARTIVAVLEDAGIEAFVFVLGNLGLPMPLSPGARGIPVQVRQSTLEQSRVVLAECRKVGASVDWDSVDVGDEPPFEPRRRPLRSLVRLAAIVVLTGGAAAGVTVAIGTTMSVTLRTFALSSLVTLIVMAFMAGTREWTDGSRRDEPSWDPPRENGPARGASRDPDR